MAGKLKRVDGVSNKKNTAAREPGGNKRAARTPAPGAGKPGADRDRAKVEKRRRKAAAKARTADASQARARKVEPAAPPAGKKKPHSRTPEKARAKATKKKPDKGKAAPGVKERRSWALKVISPRTVVPVILVAVFIALSASPVASNLEATSKLKAMERELARQRKTTESLRREVAQARSMAYVEEEARRQRMVAPGEVLYLVTTESEGPDVEYRLKALQSMDEAWERVRQMLHCTAERQAGGQ